jgi:hypothetical protein
MNDAARIVSEASNSNAALLEELAEPLAEYMLADYAAEGRDSSVVEALGRVAALLEAEDRNVPPEFMNALRKAAEAGRHIGVA